MDIKEAKESLNKILEYWKTIKDIEDPIEREIEENLYVEEMPFIQIQTVLSELEKSISKSKIEEKINELKEKNKGPIAVYEFRENGIKIEALEELLKGE